MFVLWEQFRYYSMKQTRDDDANKEARLKRDGYVAGVTGYCWQEIIKYTYGPSLMKG